MKFWRLCVITRSIIQDGQKISFFDNGIIISLPGLLNMFEVMPMPMGSELALKGIQMKKIFFWEVC